MKNILILKEIEFGHCRVQNPLNLHLLAYYVSSKEGNIIFGTLKIIDINETLTRRLINIVIEEIAKYVMYFLTCIILSNTNKLFTIDYEY